MPHVPALRRGFEAHDEGDEDRGDGLGLGSGFRVSSPDSPQLHRGTESLHNGDSDSDSDDGKPKKTIMRIGGFSIKI